MKHINSVAGASYTSLSPTSPPEELRTDRYSHAGMEMLLIMRVDHHIRSESINHHTDQMVFSLQCDLPVLAAVHAEGNLYVCFLVLLIKKTFHCPA